MSWALIADSSCNLRGYTPSAPDTIYRFAPLKVNVGGQEYVDDEALDVAELNRRVAAEESATSSACPRGMGRPLPLSRQRDCRYDFRESLG